MAKKATKGQPPEADLKKIKARVEKKIKKASDYPLTLSMVIYARPKVGKTRFAASAPDCLIIDCDEKGTDSTRDDLNPNVIRITHWSEINDIYWYLQSGDHNFKSVAIDPISALQTICMNFVLGDEVARDASRDPDQPSQRVYQKISQLMKTQITNFRNLPMNVIFTAHTRTKETGEGEEEVVTMTGPNTSPAIQSHLLGAVGLIGYMTKREVIVKVPSKKDPEKKISKKVSRTRLLIGPSERFETGVRYSGLKDLDHLDSPTFDSVLALIQKKKEA